MLTMSFADLLFRCMSDTQIIHNATLQAIDIIHELCAQLLVLLDWSFSEEHCSLTTRLLSAFTGFTGMQTCPPDPCLYHQTTSQPALLNEAPFLNTIYFNAQQGPSSARPRSMLGACSLQLLV
jgi:hypothetical protein